MGNIENFHPKRIDNSLHLQGVNILNITLNYMHHLLIKNEYSLFIYSLQMMISIYNCAYMFIKEVGWSTNNQSDLPSS